MVGTAQYIKTEKHRPRRIMRYCLLYFSAAKMVYAEQIGTGVYPSLPSLLFLYGNGKKNCNSVSSVV